MVVGGLFLAVPRDCLRFVIVVFPDHTHYYFRLTKGSVNDMLVSVLRDTGATIIFVSGTIINTNHMEGNTKEVTLVNGEGKNENRKPLYYRYNSCLCSGQSICRFCCRKLR